jgi:hypothetical protein
MIARLVLLVAGIAAAMAPYQVAEAQTVLTYIEDFEGEFPGPQGIWGNGYSFHGGALADPVVVEEVASTGFNSAQSYQITMNASNNIGDGSWGWYYGLGSFPRFSGGAGDGAAQGQAGQDNPANFSIQFDLKVAGATNQAPVRGEIALYKPDYEAVFNVDLNLDGDMADGFDIWVAGYAVPNQADNYADWHHVTLNLAQINAPTAPAPMTAPVFDDESTFVFRAFWGAGEFGIDDGNVVNFDNVALVFTPPPSADFDGLNGVNAADLGIWKSGFGTGTTPAQGDADHNTRVDGNDFLIWQRQVGTTVAAPAANAVPEPCCTALACCGLTAAGLTWRRRTPSRRTLGVGR